MQLFPGGGGIQFFPGGTSKNKVPHLNKLGVSNNNVPLPKTVCPLKGRMDYSCYIAPKFHTFLGVGHCRSVKATIRHIFGITHHTF